MAELDDTFDHEPFEILAHPFLRAVQHEEQHLAGTRKMRLSGLRFPSLTSANSIAGPRGSRCRDVQRSTKAVSTSARAGRRPSWRACRIPEALLQVPEVYLVPRLSMPAALSVRFAPERALVRPLALGEPRHLLVPEQEVRRFMFIGTE